MKGNLFDNIPEHLPDEVFQTLIQSGNMKIERIIKNPRNTPTELSGGYKRAV